MLNVFLKTSDYYLTKKKSSSSYVTYFIYSVISRVRYIITTISNRTEETQIFFLAAYIKEKKRGKNNF